VIPDVPSDVASMGNAGDGERKIFVTDAITPDLGGPGAFAWNPTKPEQLAVVRDEPIFPEGPLGSSIWLVNFDGSDPTRLTPPIEIQPEVALLVLSMDWAPDGSFIAFDGIEHFGGGNFGQRAIFRVEIEAGGNAPVTQLTFPQFGGDYRPVVSPDNTEILFGRESDGWDLRKIRADGANEAPLSPLMGFPLGQAGWDWSPDGAEIVVTEDRTTQGGVVISRVPRSTNPTSFFSDANAGKVGRRGGGEIQDRHPSWRP
jgi:dipeptidyl aminopeptidase/acylaminoacyl peptidase